VSTPLDALARRLRTEDRLLAGATQDPPPGTATPLGDEAAAGERTREDAAGYALLVEAIREGYLVHYGRGRVVVSDDADLELLAGDHLYALGLDRLAELGDLESVQVLAGVIARCARAHAEQRPQDADVAWREGVAAVAARGGPSGETYDAGPRP
jgi:hypothetical protein